MIQNTVLFKLFIVFAMAFGLVFGGTSIASAEQDYPGENLQKRFPSWKNQCYGIVTYKTDGRNKFVKRQFRIINKNLDNWTFIEVNKKERADINIKFKTPERIARQSDGEWVGIVYYKYKGYGKNKKFRRARAIVPNSGFGWKTITTHEIWHAAGVAHVPQGYRPSVMNPYMTDKIINGQYPDPQDFGVLRSVDSKCKNTVPERETVEPEKDWTVEDPRSADDILDDHLGPLP